MTVLEAVRRARQLTQVQLARKVGVQAADICRIEKGYGSAVSRSALAKLSAFLKISGEQLIEDVTIQVPIQ
jgi:transcriptional regulator with XRE-family HTH domain